ncbi:MAG TPA: CBS domain-containing protein [Anaerolineales bacterium]|nr:CBS domain-containing protein [Anaerolineales bacterium]
MYIVRHCLQTKGNQVYSIHPEASVYEALRLMAEKDIGALLVMEAEKVVGIFSERDYARKVVLHGKSSKETPVREVMTARVVFVRPDQSLDECMALMTNKRIRHLPVVEGDRVVGVISIGDVVKEIIAEQEFVIEQLANYISGER